MPGLEKNLVFAEWHFIAALQLRANVIPTGKFLGRGRSDAPRLCRQCQAKYDLVSHIQGQCPVVQGLHVLRHNKICDILAGEAKMKNWKVYHELHFRNRQDALRKPDLIFVKGGMDIVTDATVRFKYHHSGLQEAAQEKVNYYKELES